MKAIVSTGFPRRFCLAVVCPLAPKVGRGSGGFYRDARSVRPVNGYRLGRFHTKRMVLGSPDGTSLTSSGLSLRRGAVVRYRLT